MTDNNFPDRYIRAWERIALTIAISAIIVSVPIWVIAITLWRIFP